MIQPRLIGLALAFIALAAPTVALAHAQLQQAVPAVGGTVGSSPKDLRLRFSEGVEAHFSRVTLATEAGPAVPLGRPTVDPTDSTLLVIKIGRTLQPGSYTVTWHVVSVDTHKTQGNYSFTVSP